MSQTSSAMLPEGEYVEIQRVLLTPQQRAANLPEDTKATPYTLKLNGFLVAPSAVGQEARVRSLIGREHTGTLIGRFGGYHHSFGEPVPELVHIGLPDVSASAQRPAETAATTEKEA